MMRTFFAWTIIILLVGIVLGSLFLNITTEAPTPPVDRFPPDLEPWPSATP